MKITAKDRAQLLQIIRRFPRQRVVVLGDLVADEFVHGEIARVSREAPVLILKERARQIFPGGGANAANNLADLGARVHLVGAVGQDRAGDALLAHFQSRGIPANAVMRPPDYVTPTKSRILGRLGHSHAQQIVRIDKEPQGLLGEEWRLQLTARAAELQLTSSGTLVSDYGYGAANAQQVKKLASLRPNPGAVITADSRYDFRSYTGLTAATPNEPEIEAAYGQPIGDDIEKLHRLATLTLRRQRMDSLLVTRGREGMVLYQPKLPPLALPIFGSDQVADVTGAGDTVIAAYTLALAARASFRIAAMLANVAGGLVVMKSGTATVSGAELAEAIRNA